MYLFRRLESRDHFIERREKNQILPTIFSVFHRKIKGFIGSYLYSEQSPSPLILLDWLIVCWKNSSYNCFNLTWACVRCWFVNVLNKKFNPLQKSLFTQAHISTENIKNHNFNQLPSASKKSKNHLLLQSSCLLQRRCSSFRISCIHISIP